MMKALNFVLMALCLMSGVAYADTCKDLMKKDPKAAIGACQAELAQSPDSAETQFYLGAAYDRQRDFANAQQWYTKAAEQGNAYAQFNLGLMYEEGEGIKQDYAKAAELYAKAAEQNFAPAQYNLGVLYRYGDGVTKDKAKAKELFKQACDNGFEEACK